MKKWPTVAALSEATLEEVNSLWSGLGYYSRARLVYEGAKKVVADYGGTIPNSAEKLKSVIPGIGRYTAGAIASIAFNEQAPVLDGNVIRVLTRLRCIGAPVQLNSTNLLLWKLADQLVDLDRPGDFNQALMELGAVVCTPKQPSCTVCPLGTTDICMAYAQERNALRSSAAMSKLTSTRLTGSIPPPSAPDIEDCTLCISSDVYKFSLGVTNFPVKLSKRPVREETTVVVVLHVMHGGLSHFLLFQRPKTGLLASLWEFPSQKVDAISGQTVQLSEVKKVQLAIMDRIKSALESTRLDDSGMQSIGQVR
ncbi:unnamed protein product [Echinostoma caproni]|uniref:Adenine DNA glycosylase n=1 Tax=Echinostoma caproni TaxID=27848 RepID=A0A183ALF4_9TREM|nr:unnamed protein product [Echinostoma caproni]